MCCLNNVLQAITNKVSPAAGCLVVASGVKHHGCVPQSALMKGLARFTSPEHDSHCVNDQAIEALSSESYVGMLASGVDICRSS